MIVSFDCNGPLPSALPDVTRNSVFVVFCQGDMELALESYDFCVGLLQSKPKTSEGKHYTISLPNLRVDAAISVEEVSGLIKHFTLIYRTLFFYIIIVNF